MASFVELTETNGTKIWVNLDLIVHMKRLANTEISYQLFDLRHPTTTPKLFSITVTENPQDIFQKAKF